MVDLIPSISRKVIRYGIGNEVVNAEKYDYQAVNIEQNDLVVHFDLHYPLKPEENTNATENVVERGIHRVSLNMAGRHNVLNSLAVIAMAHYECISIDKISRALNTFQGVGRRFDVYSYEAINKQVTVVDDYGHHPNEMIQVIQTVRQTWGEKRLVYVFQPHRYSRTSDLYDQFVEVLSLVDELVLLPVYAAGENVISSATSKALAKKIRATSTIDPTVVTLHDEGQKIVDTPHVISLIENITQDGDVCVFQGAGTITQLAKAFVR